MTNEIFSVVVALYNRTSEFVCDHCYQNKSCKRANRTEVNFRVTVGDGILNIPQCQVFKLPSDERKSVVSCTPNPIAKTIHCVFDEVFPADKIYVTCPLDRTLQNDAGLVNPLDFRSEFVSIDNAIDCTEDVPIDDIKVSAIDNDCSSSNFNTTWTFNTAPVLYHVTLYQSKEMPMVTNTMKNYHLLHNLIQGNEYRITVNGCDTAFHCNTSSMLSLNFTVPVSRTTIGNITDLRNTTYNETFISIAWKYLSVQNQTCEKSISYLVNISFYNNTTPSTNTSTSSSQNHILPNLISGTAYSVTVTATDGDKIGMSDTVVIATRKQDIPIKDKDDESISVGTAVALGLVIGFVIISGIILSLYCCKDTCRTICSGVMKSASNNSQDGGENNIGLRMFNPSNIPSPSGTSTQGSDSGHDTGSSMMHISVWNSDNDSSRPESLSVDHPTNITVGPDTLSLGQDHNVPNDDIVENTVPGLNTNIDSESVQNVPAVQCSDNMSVNMSSNVYASIAVNSSLYIPTNTETPGSNVFTDIPADAPVEDNVVDLSLSAQAITSNVPVFVAYYKDYSVETVLNFTDLLRNCGINADVDIYHTSDNPDDWSLLVENQIKYCIDNNGFVILLWSDGLAGPLQDETQNNRIQMSHGHIYRATLRNLIQEHLNLFILVSFVPVSIHNLPPHFKDRTIYTIPMDEILERENLSNDILCDAELIELKDLIATITRRTEILQ